MDYTPLIGIILFIIISTVVIHFLGKMFKGFIYITTIFSIFIAVLGFFVYQDITDLTQSLPIEEKILLLQDSDNILSGIQFKEINMNDLPVVFSNEQLNVYSEQYSNSEYDKMLGDSYKLFILKDGFFDDITSLSLGQFEISKDEALDVLAAKDAGNLLLKIYATKLGVDPSLITLDLGSSDQVKAMVSLGLLQEKMKGGVSVLFNEFTQGKVFVYPETISIKLLKYLPASYLEKMV